MGRGLLLDFTPAQIPASVFIPFLRDCDGSTIGCAVRALGRIGPSAVSAVPDLIDLLHGKDDIIRADAVWALGRIDHAADEVIGHLLKILREGDDAASTAAAAVLGESGLSEVMPPLFEAIHSKNNFVAPAARAALLRLSRCHGLAVMPNGVAVRLPREPMAVDICTASASAPLDLRHSVQKPA